MQKIRFITSAAICALLLTACATQQQESHTSASASVNAVSYACGNGVSILASYPDVNSATIQYKGKKYNLRIAKSADGARYVGGGFEWWTKGSGVGSHGTLFQHNQDGTSGKRLEFCTVKQR